MQERLHAPRPKAIAVSLTTSSVVRTLAVLAAALIAWRLLDLILLVFTAFVVASAILPLALALEKRGLRRVWTVVGVFALILIVVAVLSALTAPTISAQTQRLEVRAPAQLSRASDWLTGRLSHLAGHPVQTPDVSGQAAQYLRQAGAQAVHLTAQTAGAFGGLLLVIVLAGFLVVDQDRARAGFLHLLPPKVRETAGERWDRVQERLGGYVGGMALISVEKVFFFTLTLRLLGVPSALLLGLLAGLLNFVPYAGFWTVFVLAELLAFNADPIKGLWVLALFLGHEWFKSGLLGPFLIGRAVKLHPAVVLVAIAAGAKLFGVLGTLVAVPLAAAVSIVLTAPLPVPSARTKDKI